MLPNQTHSPVGVHDATPKHSPLLVQTNFDTKLRTNVLMTEANTLPGLMLGYDNSKVAC